MLFSSLRPDRRAASPREYGHASGSSRPTGADAMSSSILCSTGGTLFGLQSRAHGVDPDVAAAVVHWKYDWHPSPGSPEARLYTTFCVRASGCERHGRHRDPVGASIRSTSATCSSHGRIGQLARLPNPFAARGPALAEGVLTVRSIAPG